MSGPGPTQCEIDVQSASIARAFAGGNPVLNGEHVLLFLAFLMHRGECPSGVPLPLLARLFFSKNSEQVLLSGCAHTQALGTAAAGPEAASWPTTPSSHEAPAKAQRRS
jgi:hypothetical protein